MSRFIKHTHLGREIIQLFEEAEEGITIVSPYIKLHEDIKKALRKKMQISDFYIEVMYGKNQEDLSKSLSKEDLDFFKGFKNVNIHYQENLHAKYYANESKSIITSINLHEYSLNHNIEVGILLERKFLGIGGDNSMDSEAFEYFTEVFRKSKSVYSHQEKETKHFFGLFRTLEGKEILEDNTKKMYSSNPPKKQETVKTGYCIRTGTKIPFNPDKPFSAEGFKLWNQYKNKNYKEEYCHYSGEKSNKETSFSNPILSKYQKLVKS